MRDVAPVLASGRISIYKIVNNKRELVLTSKNTILPNAQTLLALVMSGDNSAELVYIRLYDGVALTFAAPITTKTYVDPLQVSMEALCSDVSFAGDMDNAKLGPDDAGTLGNFAEAAFASVSKTLLEPLLVNWTITFQIPE